MTEWTHQDIKDLFKELSYLNLSERQERFVNNTLAFYKKNNYITVKQKKALIRIKSRRSGY